MLNLLFVQCCRTLQTDDNMIRNINALQVHVTTLVAVLHSLGLVHLPNMLDYWFVITCTLHMHMHMRMILPCKTNQCLQIVQDVRVHYVHYTNFTGCTH